MKYIGLSLCLIMWMVLTLILVCSLVGILILMSDEVGTKATWMNIGNKIIESLTK